MPSSNLSSAGRIKGCKFLAPTNDGLSVLLPPLFCRPKAFSIRVLCRTGVPSSSTAHSISTPLSCRGPLPQTFSIFLGALPLFASVMLCGPLMLRSFQLLAQKHHRCLGYYDGNK